VPFQTGCEELIFRGYLMQGFALCTKSKAWALVITSVMFGLLHCANNEVSQYGFFKTIPLYILIGLQMGFFAILSDGIEFSWGMHFINNFIAFTIISTEGGTLSGNALFMTKREAVSVTDYIVIIAEFALIYFLLHKKMGWDIKKAFDNSGLRKDVPPPYFA
jgi:membrane protease YdiL (CAAX protease family)